MQLRPSTRPSGPRRSLAGTQTPSCLPRPVVLGPRAHGFRRNPVSCQRAGAELTGGCRAGERGAGTRPVRWPEGTEALKLCPSQRPAPWCSLGAGSSLWAYMLGRPCGHCARDTAAPGAPRQGAFLQSSSGHLPALRPRPGQPDGCCLRAGCCSGTAAPASLGPAGTGPRARPPSGSTVGAAVTAKGRQRVRSRSFTATRRGVLCGEDPGPEVFPAQSLEGRAGSGVTQTSRPLSPCPSRPPAGPAPRRGSRRSRPRWSSCPSPGWSGRRPSCGPRPRASRRRPRSR